MQGCRSVTAGGGGGRGGVNVSKIENSTQQGSFIITVGLHKKSLLLDLVGSEAA